MRFKEQRAFARNLARHLNHCNIFEAIVASKQVCSDDLPMQTGFFDEHKLLDYREQYGVDCVLYCEMNPFVANHTELRAQPQIVLIHIPESIALVEITNEFDVRDSVTRSLYAKFRKGRGERNSNIASSPSVFVDFTAQRMAARVAAIWK